MIVLVLAASIALQFLAAILSLRLIWITGRSWAWSLIALALTLMGIRRSITLFHMLAGNIPVSPDLEAELVALFISVIMVLMILNCQFGSLPRSDAKSLSKTKVDS